MCVPLFLSLHVKHQRKIITASSLTVSWWIGVIIIIITANKRWLSSLFLSFVHPHSFVFGLKKAARLRRRVIISFEMQAHTDSFMMYAIVWWICLSVSVWPDTSREGKHYFFSHYLSWFICRLERREKERQTDSHTRQKRLPLSRPNRWKMTDHRIKKEGR